MRAQIVYALSAGAAIVSGCASIESLPPAPAAPLQWQQQTAETAAHWPTNEWYREFGSVELNALIDQSQQKNLDLIASQARIRQADARARAAGAILLPQLDAGGNVSYGAGQSHGATAHETDWSALLSASYEVNFWGKNNAAANSAKLLATASKADRDTLALTTSTSVANTYFQLLSLRERLTIAQANLDSARTVLQVIQARYDAGVTSPAELATQRASVAAAELVIPPLQQQELETRGALALLAGTTPEEFAVAAQDLDALMEPAITPGLPAELLTRRPDIFAAEANLQSAHADVQAARAAMFPSLTLTGSGGVQNPALQAAVITLAGTGYSFTVGANLLQTIFDGGRRKAAREEAAAKQQELLADYRSAILNSLLDVETALAALQHLDAQQQSQQQNVEQSERAFSGAQLRYREGSGDYLTMLDAQRTLYAAREQRSQYQLARLQAEVGLCKALGGGWQQSTAVNASR